MSALRLIQGTRMTDAASPPDRFDEARAAIRRRGGWAAVSVSLLRRLIEQELAALAERKEKVSTEIALADLACDLDERYLRTLEYYMERWRMKRREVRVILHSIGLGSDPNVRNSGTDAARVRHNSGTKPSISGDVAGDSGTDAARVRHNSGTTSLLYSARASESESESSNTPLPPDGGSEGEPVEAEKPTPRSRRTSPTDPRVAELYALYPRKEGKGKALEAIARALDRADVEVIRAGLERYLPTAQQRISAGEQQYIPHPATWFNQSRWEDEPIAAQNGATGLQYGLEVRDLQRVGDDPDWMRKRRWYKRLADGLVAGRIETPTSPPVPPTYAVPIT